MKRGGEGGGGHEVMGWLIWGRIETEIKERHIEKILSKMFSYMLIRKISQQSSLFVAYLLNFVTSIQGEFCLVCSSFSFVEQIEEYVYVFKINIIKLNYIYI